MEMIFFSGWQSLLRTVAVGVLAYAALIVLLRVSGKRTLSKLNAFDLVVTVALGSTLATALLNKNVTFADGVLAFILLVALQFVITWSAVRFAWVRGAVSSRPRILLSRGQLLDDALMKARVTRDEVRAAVRAAGHASLGDVEAVVLETDGSLSVVRGPGGDRSSLEGVAGGGRDGTDAGNPP